MGKIVVYNQEMLDIVIRDMQYQFQLKKRLNISYEPTHKERTNAQMGFIFSALIHNITEYFQECGFNVDEDDVRYKLYEEVSEVVPEMIVDKQIFGGKPRVKHLGEMDRVLCSKFIDGIFTVLSEKPLYDGLKLHPSISYNWMFHIEPEEIEIAKRTVLPERDEDYLNYIREMPCIVCGKQHRSHAHHAKIPKYVSNSKKTPDWTAIPVCQSCHLEGCHGQGHEWLLGKLMWLPVDLEIMCRLNYLRWLNKKNS